MIKLKAHFKVMFCILLMSTCCVSAKQHDLNSSDLSNKNNTNNIISDYQKPKSPNITPSKEGWSNEDVYVNIELPHNTEAKILQISKNGGYIDEVLESMGYNVTTKLGITDISEIEKYDVILLDNSFFTIQNAPLLNKLYNLGKSIITIANDGHAGNTTSEQIIPIVEEKRYELGGTYRMVNVNEITYRTRTYNSVDKGMFVISKTIPSALSIYTVTRDNITYPGVVYIENDNGGKWIHSQMFFTKDAPHVAAGMVDYITDYISPVHIADVQFKVNDGEWVSYYGQELKFSEEGLYTIQSRTLDNNGQYSDEKSVTFGIDKTQPTISSTISPVYWTNSDVNVSPVLADNLAGIRRTKWALGDKTITYFESEGIEFVGNSFKVSENTRVSIYTEDNAGNKSLYKVNISNIDKVAPNAIIACPSISNSREVSIDISNIVEIQSGMKEILIAENSEFTENRFSIQKTNISDVAIKYTLSKKQNTSEHFSTRIIFVKLVDSVGNASITECRIKLTPSPPDKPVILLPVENQLFVSGEDVLVKWTYNSSDENFTEIPQVKADVAIKNTTTNEVRIIQVNGDAQSITVKGLNSGLYTVSVKVYNSINPNIDSTSDDRVFRCDLLANKGNVFTVDINPFRKIQYISVVTSSEVPQGTELEGRIYYESNTTGQIDYSKYEVFSITREKQGDNIVKLPYPCKNIKIEYRLLRTSSNSELTPSVDWIIVYAK